MESTVVTRDDHRPAPHGLGNDVVVVGYSGSANSEAALRRGAAMVPQGGHLVVLRCLPPIARPQPGAPDQQAERHRHAISSLLAAVPEMLPARATYEIRVVAGPAAVALAETAERYGAAEVVIGGHGGSAPTVHGDVAADVNARTRIPVEVVTARRPLSGSA